MVMQLDTATLDMSFPHKNTKKSSDQDQSEIHWRNWSWWWCIMLETRLRFQNPTNKYDILAQLAGRIGWLRWWGSRPSFDRLILWGSRTRSPSYCKILLAPPSDGDATRYCNFSSWLVKTLNSSFPSNTVSWCWGLIIFLRHLLLGGHFNWSTINNERILLCSGVPLST